MKRQILVCIKCEYLHYNGMGGGVNCRKWSRAAYANDFGGAKSYIEKLPENFYDRPVPVECAFRVEHLVMGINDVK